MKGFNYLKNVTTLDLDTELCTGCGMCEDVCPHLVFALSGNKAQIVDRDACMECGACARNCPVAAIAVDAGVGCATGILHEWLRGWKSNAGREGCCG